jgi:hypothetical protein
VGKRNREKRAAKKRARQQRGQAPPRGGFDAGHHGHDHDGPGAYPPPIPPAERLAHALRLEEAAADAVDPQANDRLLPVLADRSRVVEDTFQEMYRHTVQKSVSISNGAGWHAGRAAADRADLSIDRRAVSA